MKEWRAKAGSRDVGATTRSSPVTDRLTGKELTAHGLLMPLEDDFSDILKKARTGQGLSVREIVATVEAVLNRRVPREQAPRRPGDPPALVADPERAAQLLGWRTTRSDPENIIRSAGRWHAARLERDAHSDAPISGRNAAAG